MKLNLNLVTIPAALRSILFADPSQPAYHGTLIDGVSGRIVAASEAGMVELPLPVGTPRVRYVVPPGDGDVTVDLSKPDGLTETPGWADPIPRDASPAFRICVDVKALAALAAALGAETVTLEGPARFDDQSLLQVQAYPAGKGGHAFLVPSGPRIGQGLLIDDAAVIGAFSGVQAPATATGGAEKTVAIGPPKISYNEEIRVLQVDFGGKPPKETLEALKALPIGMHYSGRNGTKRGVPARTWYCPDNPFARAELAALFPKSKMPASQAA